MRAPTAYARLAQSRIRAPCTHCTRPPGAEEDQSTLHHCRCKLAAEQNQSTLQPLHMPAWRRAGSEHPAPTAHASLARNRIRRPSTTAHASLHPSRIRAPCTQCICEPGAEQDDRTLCKLHMHATGCSMITTPCNHNKWHVDINRAPCAHEACMLGMQHNVDGIPPGGFAPATRLPSQSPGHAPSAH